MATVSYQGNGRDDAILLLAAAQELGLDPSVVQVRPTKREFIVPDEVLEKALEDNLPEPSPKTEPEKVPAKKKAAAKKVPAKKTAATKKAATTKKEGSR